MLSRFIYHSFWCAGLVAWLFSSPLLAEGTKQIQPDPSKPCKLNLFNPELTKFASYGASESERLQISIKNPATEKVYFGFGRFFTGDLASTPNPNVYYYRILDAQDNIVYGPFLVPTTGTGFITSYSQAVAGPSVTAGASGYQALSFQPAQAGDYYIEFNPNNPDLPATGFANDFKMDLFDITVVNTSNHTPVNGRLWAKTWDLNTLPGFPPVSAKFYTYTSEGIVSLLSLNGIQPYGFTVGCNRTGVQNSGDLANDRKSIQAKKTYSEYKLFLNDPDAIVFPTGVPATLVSPSNITRKCPENGYRINLLSTSGAYADVYIEVNGIAGYQSNTRDVKFDRFIVQGGDSLIWSGKDGLGGDITPGTNVTVFINLVTGLTNFPVYDAEFNVNGFKVELIRPLPAGVSTPQRVPLYWDDSNLPGGTQNFTGCVSDPCHAWNKGANDYPAPNNGFGNERTVNTWWSSYSIASSFAYKVEACPVNHPPVTVNDAAALTENSAAITIDMNANNTDPDNNLDPSSTTVVQGPSHGTASLDPASGKVAYQPNADFSGKDTLVVRVCDKDFPPRFCANDTLFVRVKPLNPLGKVKIPEGFSPNGDGTNDFFVIEKAEDYQLTLTIYNRWGSVVYSNPDYHNEWNGTSNSGISPMGKELPDGTYFYVADFHTGQAALTRYLTLKR